MNTYPAYYRKGPVCIKREDPKTGKQIDLSQQAMKDPFKVINTPDKASFDKLISCMELVSFETYERYLILLHNKSKYEAKSFREMHNRSPEFVNPLPPRGYYE